MKTIINKIMIVFFISIFTIFILPTTKQVYAKTNDKNIFEFRGSWVATVNNIDIGKQNSSSQTDINAYKNQFLQILNTFEAYNMNTVIFQVRPINDAFYQSNINPWSRFLIGNEGVDPGWDPMAWMIEECHKRGLEFHAWLNPYRASLGVLPSSGPYETELNNYLKTLDDKNFAKHNPDLLVRGKHDNNDFRILLNPASPKVRQHIYDTIEEIVRNYNVDAIHFDDYFYNGVENIEDDKDYDAYRSLNPSPMLTKGDWRREQVNILVENIHYLIKDLNVELKRKVEFGISPAGVWAPADDMGCGFRGQPGGMPNILCGSYSSYIDLFADTKKWVENEWIDYILPQNYGNMYESDGTPRNHMSITSWWAEQVQNVDVKLYIGLAPYQYGLNSGWTVLELENQMVYANALSGVDGFAMYSITSLRTPTNANFHAAMQTLKARWNIPTLVPIKGEFQVDRYETPNISITRNTNHVNLSFENKDDIYGYILYRVQNGEPFDKATTPIFDVVPNQQFDYLVRHRSDNMTDYEYYIQTFYNDGLSRQTLTRLTTGIYDYNVAPVVKNVKMETDLLFFDRTQWIVLNGEVYDANNDDLTITIKLISNSYTSRDYNVNPMEDGSFSERVYIPAININRGHLLVLVYDGLITVSYKSYSFYVPKSNYTNIMQNIMTMEIINNETIEGIFR